MPMIKNALAWFDSGILYHIAKATRDGYNANNIDFVPKSLQCIVVSKI